MIRKFFRWIFKAELEKLEQAINSTKANDEIIRNVLTNAGVSVDVNEYNGRSWACISIQGRREDFIKFVDLSGRDICEIQHFLRHFDRKNRTIDAAPQTSGFLKFS